MVVAWCLLLNMKIDLFLSVRRDSSLCEEYKWVWLHFVKMRFLMKDVVESWRLQMFTKYVHHWSAYCSFCIRCCPSAHRRPWTCNCWVNLDEKIAWANIQNIVGRKCYWLWANIGNLPSTDSESDTCFGKKSKKGDQFLFMFTCIHQDRFRLSLCSINSDYLWVRIYVHSIVCSRFQSCD